MATRICKENIMFELSQKNVLSWGQNTFTHRRFPWVAYDRVRLWCMTCKFPTSYWIDFQQVKFVAGSKTQQHLIILYLQ